MTLAKLKSNEIRKWEPQTHNQQEAYRLWSKEDKNLILHGYAGTGKTYLSMQMAFDTVIKKEELRKVHIIRSVVPTRDMGFLPGDDEDKVEKYKRPYQDMMGKIFENGKVAWERAESNGQVLFDTTSFIRGTNIENSVVIVDEIQNMTFHELDSIITRLDDHSRIIFCGDGRQTDFLKNKDREGLRRFLDIIQYMSRFEMIEFGKMDVVRSGLVREYIIAKEELNERQSRK